VTGAIPIREHRIHGSDDTPLFVLDAGPIERHRSALLCLPGLTRSSKDFRRLIARVAPRWRMICPDYRGRGQSGRKTDPKDYGPPQLIGDALATLDALGIHRFAILGVSLGGLIGLGLSVMRPGALTGVFLVDIGPEFDAEGLQRIRMLSGNPPICETWAQAIDFCKRSFPGLAKLDEETFREVAETTFVEKAPGRIVPDFDPKVVGGIGDAGDSPFDLWALFRNGAAGRPLALLAGGISDLLTPEIVARMQAAVPSLQVTMDPDFGHVPPVHDEPGFGALTAFLAQVEKADLNA